MQLSQELGEEAEFNIEEDIKLINMGIIVQGWDSAGSQAQSQEQRVQKRTKFI